MMNPIPNVRGLAATLTPSARLGRILVHPPSCAPSTKGTMQVHCAKSRTRGTNPPATRRHLSTTASISSASPFRLTSNKSSSNINPPSSSSSSSPAFLQPVSPDPSLSEPIASPGATHEYYSPYKPKRQWPPDMSKLSPKHQFRLERKYRRRAALKYARPTWTKATILVQWGVIGFVIIYAVLFMEWESGGPNPFEEVRKKFFAALKSLFPPPPDPKTMRIPGLSDRDQTRD